MQGAYETVTFRKPLVIFKIIYETSNQSSDLPP